MLTSTSSSSFFTTRILLVIVLLVHRFASTLCFSGHIHPLDIQHSLTIASASGVCRCLANLASFPFDTITTRKEALRAPLCPSWRTIDQCQACEPLDSNKKLYAGVNGMIIETFTSVVVVSLAHDVISSWIGQEPMIIAGLEWPLAVIATCIPLGLFTTPAEIVKQRVQVGYQPNILRASRAIFACHGIAGFYWPYVPMIYRDVSFNLLQSFMVALLTVLVSEGEVVISHLPRFPEKFDWWISSAILIGSTAFAAILTQPLDVRKTRLATSSGIKTIFGVLASIFEEDRKIQSLYIGLGPRVLALSISTALYAMADSFFIQKL